MRESESCLEPWPESSFCPWLTCLSLRVIGANHEWIFLFVSLCHAAFFHSRFWERTNFLDGNPKGEQKRKFSRLNKRRAVPTFWIENPKNKTSFLPFSASERKEGRTVPTFRMGKPPKKTTQKRSHFWGSEKRRSRAGVGLVARILVRTITEGSTAVMRGISARGVASPPAPYRTRPPGDGPR